MGSLVSSRKMLHIVGSGNEKHTLCSRVWCKLVTKSPVCKFIISWLIFFFLSFFLSFSTNLILTCNCDK